MHGQSGELMKIILKNICKSYGGKLIIDHVSLELSDRHFTTLLGPSGCGKTTLLRMIAGLERPDEGEIWLGDTCVSAPAKGLFVPPEKRGLAFVFQDFALWPHMTVFENVAFGLRAAGRTDHLKENVEKALFTVKLDHMEKRYPHELSGGQQQRVSFARAIALKPECILFDEPLSALDAILRIEMRGEIRRLVKDLGITAVFVTHDQEEAMSMSDAIAVISSGKIEQYGKPEEIYAKPATNFVAHFVGSSNWIDETHLFRPEKGSMEKTPGTEEFRATVTNIQFLGHTYEVHMDYNGADWLCWSANPLPAGSDVSLYVKGKDVISL